MTPPIRFVPSSGTTKTALDLAHLMAKAAGGPYEILIPLTDKVRYPNGSLAGPIRMLVKGEADIALCQALHSENNKQFMDLTYPISMKAITFMVPKKAKTADITSIFRPYSHEAWIALFVSSFAMSLLLYALLMKRCHFSHILNNIIRSLLQQSVSFKLEREKWFMFTWFLGVFFLTCCYLSLLLSFLTFPPQNEIRDTTKLAEEARHGRFEISTTKKVMVKRLLDSEDESMKIMGKSIEENPSGVESLTSFVFKKKKNRALVSDRYQLNLFQEDFFVSNDYFHFYFVSYPVRKGFCCIERINMGIHRITAAGLLSRHENLEHNQRVDKIKLREEYKDDDRSMSLTIVHLEGAFMILGIGLGLASCTLLIEIFVKKHKNRRIDCFLKSLI